jgi:integrase
MGKKGQSTESSPLSWNQFQDLLGRMALEVDRLESGSKQKQMAKFLLLISVGCYTGLRISDLLALKWSMVLNKDVIELREIKTSKARTLTLNENLKKLLTKYFNVIRPQTPNEFIFTDRNDDGVISIQYINRQLKRLFKLYNIKIKNPSSHTLRKTFGRRVFEMNFKNDEALILLSQIFNHANTAITRRYIGLSAERIGNVYLSL